MDEKISFIFEGYRAAENKLDLYDASISLYGAARVFPILGHYYQTGKIISHAPKSAANVYIYPAEPGSYKQTIAVSVVTAVLTAPFGKFADRVFDSWFPPANPQMEQVIQLLQEQNQLLRQQRGLPPTETPQEQSQNSEVDAFIQSEQARTEIQVLRSIVATSTRNMFRPVGRSAKSVSITYGEFDKPIAVLDEAAVARLEIDEIDSETTTIVGVVNSFSRSSKAGLLFSQDFGRGVLFELQQAGALPPGDDCSWSQYSRRPIELRGRFTRWFDGSIKKFIADSTSRAEIEE